MLLTFPAEARDTRSPEDAALAFYQSYLKYQNDLAGKTRSPKEAAEQERKATQRYLTAGFWRKLVASEKKCSANKDEIPAGCDSNPFFCAQEPPTSATISKAEKVNGIMKGQKANVPVALCFNCRPENSRADQQTRVVQAHMHKALAGWLLDQVDCPK
ncbi:MAG: hypothetical protein ACXVBL_08945 [Bdellovibrionota bacterium]